MFIIYGHRTYGKTDVVPSFFHVATKFAHIYYFPLFPTGSYLVLSQNGNRFTGISIPMSAKSVFLGWGRAVAFLAAMVFAIIGVILLTDTRHLETGVIVFSLLVAAIAIAAIILSYKLKSLTHASYNRAYALALKAGATPESLARLRQQFGLSEDYSPVHGFPVTPSATLASTPPPQFTTPPTTEG